MLLKNSGGLLPLRTSQKVYVAGSNADDLGNQTGGWTITWQGASGDTPRAPRSCEGDAQGPADDVTYSKDASAPMTGYDVGVVVVGETPYAEGVGRRRQRARPAADGRRPGRRRQGVRGHEVRGAGRLRTPAADRRPARRRSTPWWRPGCRARRATAWRTSSTASGPSPAGCPVTWPRSEAQLPINVGDTAYDPQFPYGWGLTTLTKVPAGGAATLRALGVAAAAAERAGADSAGRALVSRARLIVQRKVGTDLTAAVAKPFADADHLLAAPDGTERRCGN